MRWSSEPAPHLAPPAGFADQDSDRVVILKTASVGKTELLFHLLDGVLAPDRDGCQVLVVADEVDDGLPLR